MRSQLDPEDHPEAVREVARCLTDQEIGHWCGMASRRIFLLGWRRMTPEQIESTFGAEEPETHWPPHRLPNGLCLLVNLPVPPPDPKSVLIPETVRQAASRQAVKPPAAG